MAIRVIGVGDNVVDKYMHTKTMYPGGNAFNFSAYASMLGASSSYMGVFGSDEAAQLVQATARELGIDTSHCRVEEGENGYAMIRRRPQIPGQQQGRRRQRKADPL